MVAVDSKKAHKMAGPKLPNTTRTLATTASTSPARRSHNSGTENAEMQNSSSATTKPETAAHLTKLTTPAAAGIA